MSNRLWDKVIVVTAAGQGIGKATALAFAAEGAKVWAIDKKAARLRDLVEAEPAILPLPVDVTEVGAVKELPNTIGSVDTLFNCVGYVHQGTILECSEADWEYSFTTNVKSMYFMIRAFLPGMLSKGSGNIINMGSAVSSLKSKAKRFAYGATKGAVIALTKSVACDFAGQGIRCNAICPTVVDTPSLRERIKATDNPEATYQAFVAQQPLGRMGTAEDVAQLAVFLASDDSSFITGTASIIDGGKLT